jgi:hypothetical protein
MLQGIYLKEESCHHNTHLFYILFYHLDEFVLINIHGVIHYYNIGHAQFVWDIRNEPVFREFYGHYWKDQDLLVSFDGANFSRYSPLSRPWPHTDQSPKTKTRANIPSDFKCVQGLLNLRECGSLDGGLVVYKKSHLSYHAFCEEIGYSDASNWHKFYGHNDEELSQKYKEYLEKHEKVKINVEAGDAIFWYSHTVHYATSPETKNGVRMATYVSMLPRKFANRAEIEKRKKYAEDLRTTNHWACINLKVNAKEPRHYGAENVVQFNVDTKSPVLNQQMKRLIGYE